MMVSLGIVILMIFTFYIIDFKKNRPTIKIMVVISMLSALSLLLSFIYIIRYPQDGGITLFSTMPIIILSLVFGKTAGVTGGLIYGILSLINGAYIVHPIQLCLDYILAPMALGLAGIIGSDSKKNILIGTIIAVFLSVFINFMSGVIFFGEFAPEGMNVILYSFLYNYSSAGVEGVLTIILLGLIPIKRFKMQLT